MAEFPAFPLWTDAYLADTTELTTQEHGAYFLLLIAMWRAGGYVPDDDAKLARFTRLTLRQWTTVRQSLSEFLTIENGSVTQGRLLDELEKARGRSKKAAESARAKYRKTNKLNGANAVPEQCSDDASTSTSISIANKEPPTVPKGTRAVKDKSEDEGWFDEAIRYDYPKKSARLPALRAWMRLSKADKMACAHGVVDFSMRFDEKMKTAKRPREEELRFVPDLSTFINQRRWELEKEIANETANR